ncbi:MAG: helix-turn-helix domain-containing protein [Nitrosomonas sp.]|nr:helix-turn-helix domain-containing protein [Nitrosomonas sp.]
MNIHKRTGLALLDRQEIWQLYQTRLWKVVQLAEHFHVSRPTIYDVLKRARLQELGVSYILCKRWLIMSGHSFVKLNSKPV